MRSVSLKCLVYDTLYHIHSSTDDILAVVVPTNERKRNYSEVNMTAPSSDRCALYVMPPDRYEYLHPEGTGKEAPPFYSAWFIGGSSEFIQR